MKGRVRGKVEDDAKRGDGRAIVGRNAILKADVYDVRQVRWKCDNRRREVKGINGTTNIITCRR